MMLRKCKEYKERMMIVQEGCPTYTFGYYTIYGCPSCGNLEYSYEPTNFEANPIQFIDGDKEINQFHVSN